MFKSFLFCFLFVQLLSGQLLYSQTGNSSFGGKGIAPDSAQVHFMYTSRHQENPFYYKNLIIPSAMVVYGVVGLNSDGLRDVNEKLQEEIWSKNPHREINVDDYLQWAPAVAVYGLNVAGVKGKHNFKDRTIIFGISTIIMSSVVYEVKRISKETRPDGSDRYSFPSGHTANAFATAEFMRQEYKDVSPWYGIAGYAAASLTGYLRMYNNKHWLSDVVAGAGVGILSTDVAYIIYTPVSRLFSQKRSRSSTIILPTYQHGSVSIGAIHTF